MLRVMVAHQESSTRLALRMYLQAHPRVSVVCEVSRAGELLRDASLYQPELILMSWNLPDFERFSVTGHWHKTTGSPSLNQVKGVMISALHQLPSEPTIIVTGNLQEDLFPVLYAGADDYLYQGEMPTKLAALIDAIQPRGTS